MDINLEHNDDFELVNINDKEYAKICKSDELYEKKGRQIVFPGDEDRQIAVFRFQGELYALDNICPHRHQAKIHEAIFKDENIMCPLHAWTYSVKDGQNVNQKVGVKSLKTYEIFEKDGYVYVEIPELKIPKWRQ